MELLVAIKTVFVHLLNHVADFSAKKYKMTNTENDKTLFPEHFLLIRIVFLQHIRYHFKL